VWFSVQMVGGARPRSESTNWPANINATTLAMTAAGPAMRPNPRTAATSATWRLLLAGVDTGKLRLRLRAAKHSGAAGDRGDGAADEEPHGLVGRIAGEEAREARGGGVRGAHAVDEKHDATDEQCEGDGFVHEVLELGGGTGAESVSGDASGLCLAGHMMPRVIGGAGRGLRRGQATARGGVGRGRWLAHIVQEQRFYGADDDRRIR